MGAPWAEGAILPPATGFEARSFLLQMGFTGVLIARLRPGAPARLAGGIERASKILIPALFFSLLVLMVRALTLPGAGAGVAVVHRQIRWTALTPRVMAAAFGQVFFTLSLGGTLMVVYGSYLKPEDRLAGNAAMTVAGDTLSGVLAGFAILPAVVCLGLRSASGPASIFVILPSVFATIPLGRLFGLIFFVGLLGSGFLSAIAACGGAGGGAHGQHAAHPPQAVGGWRCCLPDRHAADAEQEDLPRLGPDLRLRDADPGLAARGAGASAGA